MLLTAPQAGRPGISVALGSAYFRNGTPPDAEREYREALKIDSQVGEAHNNLGVKVNPQLKVKVTSNPPTTGRGL